MDWQSPERASHPNPQTERIDFLEVAARVLRAVECVAKRNEVGFFVATESLEVIEARPPPPLKLSSFDHISAMTEQTVRKPLCHYRRTSTRSPPICVPGRQSWAREFFRRIRHCTALTRQLRRSWGIF